MAYLKADEIRKMNGDDRAKSLKDLRQELVHERGVAAMGGSPPSPGKIRQIRRQIARILTIRNEETLGIRGQTVKTASAQPKGEAVAPLKHPAKGPPAAAAQKAHAERMASQPKPVAKPAPAGAAKTSEAKKPSAAKAAPAKKPKKEE